MCEKLNKIKRSYLEKQKYAKAFCKKQGSKHFFMHRELSGS